MTRIVLAEDGAIVGPAVMLTAFSQREAFAEMRASSGEVAALDAQPVVRKPVGRAKGVLIDKFKTSENDAFVLIRRMAMSKRKRTGEIPGRNIAGTLNP